MITRYRNNPNLKAKTVTTINGETEYKKNCRKIRDKYYVIGEQCVEVEKKWYAITSKLITYDHEQKKYILLKGAPLVYGVVDFKEDGAPTLGYFTENKYKNVLINVERYGAIRALNEETLKEKGCLENISDGIWHVKRNLSPASIASMGKITSRKVFTNKGYNIEDNVDEFKEKIELFDKFPMKISASAMRYGKMLGETTYGCELETATGYLPEHIQNQTGIVICRDGSIDNAEYVTVPMRGARGLCNLKTLGVEMSKRTTVDIQCAFHIHLGNIPDDRLFIVALYALGMRIQDELFTMFPYYKIEWKGVKKKNYCQKLGKLGIQLLKLSGKEEYEKYLNDAYYRISTWLNEGNYPDDTFNRNTHRHIQRNKWDRKQRYYWLNFMNMFFSERKTMEFRIHHATTNSQKMINWLFICNAIVRYAEKYAKQILTDGKPITLDEIMDYYAITFRTKDAKFLTEYLKAYIQDRKDYFRKDYEKGDFLSKNETYEDKKFVFEYKGVKSLI